MDFELLKKVVLNVLVPDQIKPQALNIFAAYEKAGTASVAEGIKIYKQYVENDHVDKEISGHLMAAAINGLLLGILLADNCQDEEVFKKWLELDGRTKGENIVDFADMKNRRLKNGK